MMAPMQGRCADCGGPTTLVRARYEVRYPEGCLIAEEVPSVRCEACGRRNPAAHVQPQLDAVLELTQEVPGTARKDFSAVPLHPEAAP